MAKKLYSKKLTNSGGGVCVTVGLAAVIACCAAAGDFIAAYIYKHFYIAQVYRPMYEGLVNYVYDYCSAIITAVFAVIMFVWALSAAKAKRLGREFGFMGIFMGAALCLLPAVQIYSLLTSDFVDNKFRTGYDSDVFQGVVELARYGLPILSALLLFFAGIAVTARISGEDFAAELPGKGKKKPAEKGAPAKAVGGEFADPHGFGSKSAEPTPAKETKPVKETKPAPKSEPKKDEPVKEDIPPQEEKPAKKPTIKLCPECGELVGEEELFCANCGHKM